MSAEMIGILVVAGLLVAGALYYLHSKAGAAEAATLKAQITGGLASVESHLGMVHAAVLAPVQVVSVPTPTPAPPTPAAAPVAPPAASQPAPLTSQQSQNLLLYGNINGAAPGQAGSPVPVPVPSTPADNPATRPPYPSYWQLDMPNGSSATSVPFTLPAGNYMVTGTDGFSYGWCTASMVGVGAVIPGQTIHVPADLATSMTATATPGNPSSTSTRFGAQLYKTA